MAKREIQEPKVVPGGQHEDFTLTHPAFGQIGVGRSQTTGTYLYGSELNHRNTMRLTIHTSTQRRSLSNDSHFADREIITVEMSEAQWATLISSPNIGHGVPCTLRYMEGRDYPDLPPPMDKSELFKKEAAERCSRAYARLERLREVLESTTMPKKASDALRKELNMAIQELKSNLPFVLSQFEEHMEETVEKGKQELMAFAQAHGVQARRVKTNDQREAIE